MINIIYFMPLCIKCAINQSNSITLVNSCGFRKIGKLCDY